MASNLIKKLSNPAVSGKKTSTKDTLKIKTDSKKKTKKKKKFRLQFQATKELLDAKKILQETIRPPQRSRPPPSKGVNIGNARWINIGKPTQTRQFAWKPAIQIKRGGKKTRKKRKRKTRKRRKRKTRKRRKR